MALEPQLPVCLETPLSLLTSGFLLQHHHRQRLELPWCADTSPVGDTSHSTCALHSLARLHSQGPLRVFKQTSPPLSYSRFSPLMETLGKLKGKPLGKCQHLLSHGAFHVLGRRLAGNKPLLRVQGRWKWVCEHPEPTFQTGSPHLAPAGAGKGSWHP